MPAEDPSHRGLRLALIAAVAVAALLAGLWLGGRLKESGGDLPELERATVLGDAGPAVPSFSLVDHAGARFGPERLRGHWSLMFFGYTHCPDICPITLSALKGAMKALPASARKAGLEVYFVSVDPARDTPERLREYVTSFDPSFVGVTGEDAELAKLAHGLGVVYARPHPEGDDYTVEHSANLLVLSPTPRLYAVLDAPHEPDLIAHNLGALIEAYGAGRG